MLSHNKQKQRKSSTMSSVNNTAWRATLSEEQQEIWKKEDTKFLRDLRAKENAMKVKLHEWDNDFDVDDDNTTTKTALR